MGFEKQRHIEDRDLMLLAERELGPEQAIPVWEHLTECEVCVVRYRHWVQLTDALENLPMPQMPQELEGYINARLDEDQRPERRPPTRHPVLMRSAVAAALVLLLMAGWLCIRWLTTLDMPTEPIQVSGAGGPAGSRARAVPEPEQEWREPSSLPEQVTVPALVSAPTRSQAEVTTPEPGEIRPAATPAREQPEITPASTQMLATVRYVHGKPELVRDGRGESVGSGTLLVSGVELHTADSDQLLIELADEGQILVDFDSNIHLAQLGSLGAPVAAKVELREGEIWVWSPGDGEEIQVETSLGLVRVHRGEALVRTHTAGWLADMADQPGVEVMALRGAVSFAARLGQVREIPDSQALSTWKVGDTVSMQTRPLSRMLQRSSGWGRRVERWGVSPLTRAELVSDLAAPRVSLGVKLLPRIDLEQGMEVTAIEDGSPAREAGVQVGDVVLQVGERKLRSLTDLARAELELSTEVNAEVRIKRGAREMSLLLPCVASDSEFSEVTVKSLSGIAQLAAVGQIYPAIAEARRLAANEPQCAWAWYNLGLLHEHQGHHRAALESYKEAAKLMPESGVVQLALGRTYAHTGNAGQAISALQKATKLEADGRARFLLGYISLLDGNPAAAREQALALLDSVRAEDQAWGATLRALAAYSQGDPSQALRDMERGLRLDRANLNAMLYSAIINLSVGNVEQTQEELKVVLHGYPGSAKAVNLMGMTYYGEQQWHEARKWFEQGLATGLMRPVFLCNLGLTYQRSHDAGQALAYYQEAASIDQCFMPAYLGSGAALEQMSHWQAAADYYTKVLELSPDNREALARLTSLWDNHGQPELARRFNLRYRLESHAAG